MTETVTKTYTVAEWPGYEQPPTLRERLSAGTLVVDDLDVDRVGYLASGWLCGDQLAHQLEMERAYVSAALGQDPVYCPPFLESPGLYVRRWPTQEQLNGHQWIGDLLAEPSLLTQVMDLLTPEQRSTVDAMVAEMASERALDDRDWAALIGSLSTRDRRAIAALIDTMTEWGDNE